MTDAETGRKRILLVNPPLHFSRGVPRTLEVSAPHLGLLYLAGYAKQHSDAFDFHYMDVGPEQLNLRDIKARVEALRPFAIGISSNTPQLQGTLELARFLRAETRIEAPVFLGGPHVSADEGFIHRHPGLFDHAITGEAEKTFLDSLHRLLNGNPPPRLQPGQPIANLDEIPFPDRSLVKMHRYSRRQTCLLSRGCPYKCYFCASFFVGDKLTKTRYRSATNMLGELKQIAAYGGGEITFSDDTFTLKKRLVLDLCTLIREAGLAIRWSCNARVDTLDDEMIAAMRGAGCEWVFMGVEAASERLRKMIIKKGRFSNDDIRRRIDACHRHGVRVGGYFILGHPGETVAEMHQTRDMMLGYGFDGISLGALLPFPGTEMYEMAKRAGVIDDRTLDRWANKEMGEGYGGAFPVFIPEGVDRDEVFSQMRTINRKFYLNFKTFWYRLRRDLTSWNDLKLDVKQFISILTRGGSSIRPFASYSAAPHPAEDASSPRRMQLASHE